MAENSGIQHQEVGRGTERGQEYARCSCGRKHPFDEEGRMVTNFIAGCSCGRIHELVTTTDGKQVVDTGWY